MLILLKIFNKSVIVSKQLKLFIKNKYYLVYNINIVKSLNYDNEIYLKELKKDLLSKNKEKEFSKYINNRIRMYNSFDNIKSIRKVYIHNGIINVYTKIYKKKCTYKK